MRRPLEFFECVLIAENPVGQLLDFCVYEFADKNFGVGEIHVVQVALHPKYPPELFVGAARFLDQGCCVQMRSRE